MPIGKNSKTTCARKHLLLSQPNRHVLQGGGGMFCGGPTVLPPKLVGGGSLARTAIQAAKGKPQAQLYLNRLIKKVQAQAK